jgi:hypothetical protein
MCGSLMLKEMLRSDLYAFNPGISLALCLLFCSHYGFCICTGALSVICGIIGPQNGGERHENLSGMGFKAMLSCCTGFDLVWLDCMA